MGEDHSLPFLLCLHRCFIMLLLITLEPLLQLFFFFVFFAVQSRVGRKQVVKCHRPWTVWIGEDLWPQSPSNIPIFTTFWVHLQHNGLKAIRKAFIFVQKKTSESIFKKTQPFSNPWWFYMIFYIVKRIFFFFCNEIAQDIYTVVLKKKKKERFLCIL